MTEVTKDTKDYVPFQMRCRSPDAFVHGAIRYRNHVLLAHQRVVMIKNLARNAGRYPMYYLRDRIQAISGLQDVIPTKKVSQENGKFYVLVNKAEESKVRQSLQNQCERWY